MKENEFARKVTKGLRQCNAEVLSVVGSKMQSSAWPDIYIAHPYYVGWVEFKGEKTVLRKDQRQRLLKLQERGANVFVVRCPQFIEDPWGNQIGVFEMNKAVTLLRELQRLCQDTLF